MFALAQCNPLDIARKETSYLGCACKRTRSPGRERPFFGRPLLKAFLPRLPATPSVRHLPVSPCPRRAGAMAINDRDSYVKISPFSRITRTIYTRCHGSKSNAGSYSAMGNRNFAVGRIFHNDACQLIREIDVRDEGWFFSLPPRAQFVIVGRRRSRAILGKFLVIRAGNAFSQRTDSQNIRNMTFQISHFTISRLASLTAVVFYVRPTRIFRGERYTILTYVHGLIYALVKRLIEKQTFLWEIVTFT